MCDNSGSEFVEIEEGVKNEVEDDEDSVEDDDEDSD